MGHVGGGLRLFSGGLGWVEKCFRVSGWSRLRFDGFKGLGLLYGWSRVGFRV